MVWNHVVSNAASEQSEEAEKECSVSFESNSNDVLQNKGFGAPSKYPADYLR